MSAQDLATRCRRLLTAAEGSPLPRLEWPVIVGLLGDELVARLVGVSTSSVHRYRSGERDTPDTIAERAHVVTLIVSDLSGSYNEVGIRRWFVRPRSQLGGAAHEGITNEEDLAGISRALWAVEVDEHELRLGAPALPADTLTGGPDTYPACQAEAARLHDDGARGLRAPVAALTSSGARGYRIDAGLRDGPERDGETIVLFGRRPDVVGWQVVSAGRPPVDLLVQVRPLTDSGRTGHGTAGSSHG